MTYEEAKTILSVYRSDLPRDEVPALDEALALSEQDPALRAWFESEQRFDEEFAAALQHIPVPGNLAEDIIEKAASETAGQEDKVVTFPRRRLCLIAVAAAVLLVTGGLVKHLMFPSAITFPAGDFASVTKFRDDMALYAQGPFVLAKKTQDYAEVRAWLDDQGSPTFTSVPGVMAKNESVGCQSFLWGANKVSLICFKTSGDQVMHLFVINLDAFDEPIAAGQLRTVQVRHALETGGWVADEKLYLLVGSKSGVKVGDLLSGAGQA